MRKVRGTCTGLSARGLEVRLAEGERCMSGVHRVGKKTMPRYHGNHHACQVCLAVSVVTCPASDVFVLGPVKPYTHTCNSSLLICKTLSLALATLYSTGALYNRR